MVEVRRDLWRSSGPTVPVQLEQVPRTMSSWVLSISTVGNSSTSLGNVWPLKGKKHFHVFRWNILVLNVCLLPFVLSASTSEKSLASPSVIFPNKVGYTLSSGSHLAGFLTIPAFVRSITKIRVNPTAAFPMNYAVSPQYLFYTYKVTKLLIWLMGKPDFDLPVLMPVHYIFLPRHFRVEGRRVMNLTIKNSVLWANRAVCPWLWIFIYIFFLLEYTGESEHNTVTSGANYRKYVIVFV